MKITCIPDANIALNENMAKGSLRTNDNIQVKSKDKINK